MTGDTSASFVYDADGKQIKATVNGTTTVYVGNHYIIPLRDEVKDSVVTKYYFPGITRLAVHTDGTLCYLLGSQIASLTVVAGFSS